MKHSIAITMAVLTLLITGCASVPIADAGLDAKAKNFSPESNKAALYIYRNEFLGTLVPMAVTINGKELGRTVGKTYFRLSLAPGKYNIESIAENVSALPLSVDAGKNYFVWQEVKVGIMSPRSKLQQVDESAGHAGVMESSLVMTSTSGNDFTPLDAQVYTRPAQNISAMSQSVSTKNTPSNDAVVKKLRELESLRKDGIITEDEFRKKEQQLLDIL